MKTVNYASPELIADIGEDLTASATDDPRHYEKLAKAFLKYKGQLVTIGSNSYRYEGTKYRKFDNLSVAVRQWLDAKRIPQNNNKVGNVVPIIQAITSIDSTTKLPAWTGTGSRQFIAFNNGLLDVDEYLKTGEAKLLPHSPQWISTVCLPFNYDPSATCPNWFKFLDQVWEGDEDIIGKKELLAEWIGYTLSSDTSYQKFMAKVGLRRCGKGTIDKVHEALLGEEATTGYSLTSLGSAFGMASLVGKSVAFVGEVDLAHSKDKFQILETLKRITGEDAMEINAKHQPQYSIRLGVRISLSANQLPRFADPSGALAARMLVLKFNNTFEGREDFHLFNTKLSPELPGICVWALRGLARLRKQGRFTDTIEAITARNEQRRENAIVLAYIEDCLCVNIKLAKGETQFATIAEDIQISKESLEDSYMAWCRDNHKPPESVSWLGRDLRISLPRLVYDKRKRLYKGISLRGSSIGSAGDPLGVIAEAKRLSA